MFAFCNLINSAYEVGPYNAKSTSSQLHADETTKLSFCIHNISKMKQTSVEINV